MNDSFEDIDVFLEYLRWFIIKGGVAGNTLIDFLSRRFHEGFPFQGAIYVDHPAILKAELATISLLNRKHVHQRQTLVWGDIPGREVDWCQTRLEYGSRGPGVYANIESEDVVDRYVTQGLLGLVHRWHRILEAARKTPERLIRIARLKQLIQSQDYMGTTWNEAISRKLRRIDLQACIDIEAGISLWANLRGEDLAGNFERMIKEGPTLSARNINDLLEWSVAFAVVRAAVDAGWEFTFTETTIHDDRALLLKKGDFLCRVGKGLLTDGNNNAMEGAKGDDLLSRLLQAAGLGVKGIQPDIVVTFWMSDSPEKCVTFLADAKRNSSGDGSGYLASSIAKALLYATTYDEFLPLAPQFTLFMYQGVDRVLGIDGFRPLAIALTMRNEEIEYPRVFCLDTRHWVAPGADSPITAWFEHIAAAGTQSLTCSLDASSVG